MDQSSFLGEKYVGNSDHRNRRYFHHYERPPFPPRCSRWRYEAADKHSHGFMYVVR
jgi:hypothetical protein